MSSDIPGARQLIAEVMQMTGVDETAKLKLARALVLMRREPAERRAKVQEVEITDEMRAKVKLLVYRTSMTYHQIANHVGLRNTGRVSEIVNREVLPSSKHSVSFSRRLDGGP